MIRKYTLQELLCMTRQNPACDPDCTCPPGTCRVEDDLMAVQSLANTEAERLFDRNVTRFLMTATDKAWAEFLNTLVGQPRDLTPYVKALKDEP